MTKIKLSNGTIVNASDVQLVNGTLRITTSELTVEELAEIFSNKENTSLITLMTESEIETGYKKGFTSFAGINYDAEGVKTVELFQPKDVTEARISNAEATANLAKANAASADAKATDLENSITETQLGLAELAELVVASAMVEETESPEEAPEEGGTE